MNKTFSTIESARNLGDATGYSSTEVLLAQLIQKVDAAQPGVADDVEGKITTSEITDAVNRAFGRAH